MYVFGMPPIESIVGVMDLGFSSFIYLSDRLVRMHYAP